MEKTVLVLGAGATAGSALKCRVRERVFDPPTDNNFFETVYQHAPNLLDQNQRPFLRTILQLFDPELSENPEFGGIRLEQVWAFVDLCFKHFLSGKYSFEREHTRCKTLVAGVPPENINSHFYYREYSACRDVQRGIWLMLVLAGWELRTLIADVLGSIIVTPDNLFHKLWNSMIDSHSGGKAITVITFNYDLGLEKSLDASEKSKDSWYYPFIFTTKTGRTGVKIIKLHGSLNWEWTGPNLVNIQTDYSLEPVPQKFSESGCSQAAIVPPTAFKEEINLPQGQPAIVQGLFNDLWKLALEEISSANKLRIIGYSFPQLEAHADWLFRIARGTRLARTGETSKFRHVAYCYKEPNPNNAQEQRVKALFPTDNYTGVHLGFSEFMTAMGPG